VGRITLCETTGAEDVGDLVGLVGVDLAAEGFDRESFHDEIIGKEVLWERSRVYNGNIKKQSDRLNIAGLEVTKVSVQTSLGNFRR